VPAKSSGRADEVNTSEVGQLDTTALAQQLRDRRGAHLSVRRAADDAGVSFMTFSRVEAGSQPDLATFLKLCAWLRVAPETFFIRGVRRDTNTVEAVTRHLVTDPALDREAAQRIAGVVRDLYTALAHKAAAPPVVACHLRAATLLRPGVPDRMGHLLGDMHARLEQLVTSGEL
jgi:transcriptional regulator with XRE-family HTH domain